MLINSYLLRSLGTETWNLLLRSESQNWRNFWIKPENAFTNLMCFLEVFYKHYRRTQTKLASVLTSAALQYETSKSFQTTPKCQNTVSIFIKAAKALMESCTPKQRWAQPCVGSYQLTGVLWKSLSWRQYWSEAHDWIISLTKIKPWQLVQEEGAFGNTQRQALFSQTPR